MNSEDTVQDNTPRVYVASLSDYNNGDLLGRWFAFEDYDDAADLLAGIYAMLKQYDELYPSSHGEVREEFACHDYENFPERFYSESMSFEPIYAWLELTADMDEKRVEALEIFINNGHETEYFDGYYLGYHGGDSAYDDDKTAQEYVETLFWECHTKDEIPASIRDYIDFAAMARDQVLSGDIWVNSGHVFRS